MSVTAQYPTQDVTLISAAPPGGGWHQLCDHTIRAFVEEGMVPVKVTLELRGNAVQLFEEMAEGRKGDENTLVAFSPGMTIQLLRAKSALTYVDVTPVAATSTDYGVLVVAPHSPLVDLSQLITELSRNGRSVRVGGGQMPGFMHDTIVKTVMKHAGLDATALNYVPSKKPSEALALLALGDVAVSSMGLANAADALRKGEARLLAVLAKDRLEGEFSHVPTAIEQGVNVIFPMWRGFYTAAGVPDTVRAFWEQTFRQLANTTTWSNTLAQLGWFPFLIAGEEFTSFVQDDMLRYRDVIRG